VNKGSIKSDLARIDRMSDEDIDYSDIPPLDEKFFVRIATPPKRQLTIRLDADVLDWVKRHGRGYQTRINRILRVVMESQRPAAAKPRSASPLKPRSTAASKRRSASRAKQPARIAKRRSAS
jgi:uncharacterized protein (DUF4415 family)